MTQERPEYGIAIFHGAGDVLNSTPIARQLKADDPGCRIVWFTAERFRPMLANNPDLDEVVLLDGDPLALDERLEDLRGSRPWTRFFDPAPYRHYSRFPGASLLAMIQASAELTWTVPFIPVLRLTGEEVRAARDYWAGLPPGPRILVESEFYSHQSPWRTRSAFQMLDALAELDPCFVFTARNRPPFLDAFLQRHPKAVWCQEPMRINAELYNLCDAFIGVSSGISAMTFSDGCGRDVPSIEFVLGEHWSAAPSGHHRERSYCFTEQRWLEALEALRQRLGGRAAVPDFSPDFRPVITQGGKEVVPCPGCGRTEWIPQRGNDIVACPTCSLVFLRERPSSQPLPEGDLAEASVDLVSLCHSLELAPCPRVNLEQANHVLHPGGVLTVVVPNFASVGSVAMEGAWPWLERERHYTHFTPATLRAMVIQAGFQVEACTTRAGDLGEDLPLKVLGQRHPDASLAQLRKQLRTLEAAGQGEEISLVARKLGSYRGRVVAEPRPDAVRRILWVRADGLGDNLLATSMLPALAAAFPQARLTVVCQDSAAPVLEACPYADEVISFNHARAYGDPAYLAQVEALIRHASADLALNSAYSRDEIGDHWIAVSGAPRRIGCEGDLCNLTASRRAELNPVYTGLVPAGAPRRPELERHAAFLEALGAPPVELGPMFWLRPAEQHTIDNFLKALNLAPERTVALFVGAQSDKPDQRIYQGYGAALKGPLGELGLNLVALGTEQERELSQAQLDASGAPHVNLCGLLPIRLVAALLKRCRLAVGAETDLAHLAAAVGTPQVVVVGGGQFGRFMPYSPLTTLAMLPLECYGCDWQCPYPRAHCVQDLHPAVLEAAVRAALGGNSDQPRFFAQPLWERPPAGPGLANLQQP